jgi:hypothetical protein
MTNGVETAWYRVRTKPKREYITAAGLARRQGHQVMTKTLEVISEAIRNPKHSFRKVENQPNKPLKHRYERRKIRGYLQLGEWRSGEAA